MRRFFLYLSGLFLFSSSSCPPVGLAQQALEITTSAAGFDLDAPALEKQSLQAVQVDAFRRLASRARGKVNLVLDGKRRVPDFIEAGVPLSAPASQPVEQGYRFFEDFKALYRMESPREELKARETTRGRDGNVNVRYRQYYRGLEVVRAGLVFHAGPGGSLWFVQGRYIPDISISTTPTVQRPAVTRILEEDFRSRRGPEVKFTLSRPELGILNPLVFDRSFEDKNLLIWIVAAEEERTGRRWTYYVDAMNGRLLNVADSARYIDSEIWDRQNTDAEEDDELWYIDNTLWTIPGSMVDHDTVELNTFTTEYWNYLRRFGVFSIDSSTTDPGYQLIGHAYFNDPTAGITCPNACWNCIWREAVFCQGMVERDIVAHEFTHGLVRLSGADFDNENQQGALDESFADVFGEFLDCRSGNCTWIHGFTRDLANATSRWDPDHVGSTGDPFTDHPLYIPPCDPSLIGGTCDARVNDNGGVHTNSGVPNTVAYLIVNGTRPDDPHYDLHVRGIGIDKAEQLYYSTLVDAELSDTADFLETRNVMLVVCSFFANNGTHGFARNDCHQVQNAWASVGVGTGGGRINGGNVQGASLKELSPYFVTADATVPAGKAMTFGPDVDLYLFPNTRIQADGLLTADGSAGAVRILGTRGSNGTRVVRELVLRDGGGLHMPVRTFTSTDTRPHAILLRDSGKNPGMTRSFIRIDNGFTISDVNVTLSITHAAASELEMRLVSPGGTSVTLLANVGGAGADFTDTTLDDEAAVSINTGTAPFTGSFRPQGSLGAFDGENSRGYWGLQVLDGVPGNLGTIVSWSMKFSF